MPTLCAYCGQPITDTCLTFKGLAYHALRGWVDGRLIHVEREKNCFELSDMSTKSLCGQYAPAIMQLPPESR